jgi:cobaltochelatase CobS
MPKPDDLSAAEVLSRLESKGLTSTKTAVNAPMRPALHSPLAVLQGLVSAMISPNDAAAICDHAAELTAPFALQDLVPPGQNGTPPHAVLVNPTFIEQCAKQGLGFYLNGDGLVHRNDYFAAPLRPIAKLPSLTGKPDPDFYLKPDWFDDLKILVDEGQSVVLIGPAGCGKSEAVERVFQARGQKLMIVPCTPRLNANDLEGVTDLVVKDGHQVTAFTAAAPAIASEEGDGLLLDEADALNPAAAFALYRLMDGKPMHIVRRGYDTTVPLHDDFRVVGTQNTEGRGDDKGLYHARAYQDEAFLDRWNAAIRVDYPPKDQEVLILRKRTGISGSKAQKIVDAAAALRAALTQEEIMFTMSIRRSERVAENLAKGRTPEKSWRFAALNRATYDDRDKIVAILKRVYGDTWKKA